MSRDSIEIHLIDILTKIGIETAPDLDRFHKYTKLKSTTVGHELSDRQREIFRSLVPEEEYEENLKSGRYIFIAQVEALGYWCVLRYNLRNDYLNIKLVFNLNSKQLSDIELNL